ncbi:hypothetical protein Despr_0214 [Desulfobulbus propionicus DSM 2032]|uniref:Uncharacterized protein n=1 Tax=Desulfobulbus propionicus (strain ATCC 33891 / DSM 2032 / VKM B-1956 / 1pr3) TaxID=577650 RepID=A0A7U4DMV3_DESPD|nr:hypothetical protein Despr_0214 [Desulfobulbus propionicus DSM 2032]
MIKPLRNKLKIFLDGYLVSASRCGAIIRKHARVCVHKWPLTLGAMGKWGVPTRHVSFEQCPAIFGKVLGNTFFLHFFAKIAKFFHRLGELSLQISTFFFDLAKFIFNKKQPLSKD